MMDNSRWEKVFSAIQHSYTIDNHLSFFTWLQNEVNEVLSHDVLLACWGGFDNKFEGNKLHYDVASNLGEINTQSIFDASAQVNACMFELHKLWLSSNRCWFVVNNLDRLALDSKCKVKFPSNFKQLKSLVVYGVSDIRGGNECLYVFFSKKNTFEVPNSVMGLIMPHIDTVLRKIQHLESLDISGESTVVSNNHGLSGRELQIIHWIKLGKTNQEIGLILSISQNTVKSHLKRIFQKLDVTRRAQAVALLSS